MQKFLDILSGQSVLLIAVCTLLGYIAAYEYEIGYVSYFLIPNNMIQIDTVELIHSTALILLIVIGLRMLSASIELLTSISFFKKPLILIIAGIFCILLILVSLVGVIETTLIYPNTGLQLIFLFLIILLMVVVASRKINQLKVGTKDITAIMFIELCIYCFVVVLIIYTFNVFGTYSASKSQKFIVFKQNGITYALIQTYGDTDVGIEVDEKNKILKKRVILIPKEQTLSGNLEFFDNLIVKKN